MNNEPDLQPIQPVRAQRNRWVVWVIFGVIAAAFLYASRSKPSAVDWTHELAGAVQRAGAENRLVLVEFSASWCGPCRMMDNEVFSRRDVADALANWITVKIDVDEHPDVARRFRVEGYPTFVVLNPEGAVMPEFTFMGAVSAGGFIDWIDKVSKAYREQTGESPAAS